jgi:hypothetical protein
MQQYTMNIQTNNLFHLQRFQIFPPNPSYISGIIDGDGCIFIRKITDGFQSGISITQCRTNILQIIRYHFGGTITSCFNRNNNENIMDEDGCYNKYNKRNQYTLTIRSDEYQEILYYLKDSLITKDRQYKCLFEFNKYVNLTNKTYHKNKAYEECLIKQYIIEYDLFKRINYEYIAGLFDAEGCFYIDKKITSKFYISITQHTHPNLLVHIQNHLKIGKINKDKFKIYNKTDCLTFIDYIITYLIIKYNQAIAFRNFLLTDNTEYKMEMYKICNREKHEIEQFHELNKHNYGKDGYLYITNIRHAKQLICKEIKQKQHYKEKSINMLGVLNHNYGKKFSNATKNKMSISIRHAKGGIDDNQIILVRDYIKKGMSINEIMKLLNLQRHTVSKIKNGKIVCMNEKKLTPKTQIQTNILKRKINIDEIFTVLEKIIEGLTPVEMLDILIKKRAIENSVNNLTIDIVKNIKRNIKNGKHVIYKEELDENKYNDYLHLLNRCKEQI